MKRRLFLSALSALAVGSCARSEKRAERYQPSECPFCSTKSGVCSYCQGETKCTFCGGSGKRTTKVPELPAEGIAASQYEEECTYCKGSGTCRYCKGSGKCWACGGDGKVESWDFYEKYRKITQG
jgi:RecJ-like exonuclease